MHVVIWWEFLQLHHKIRVKYHPVITGTKYDRKIVGTEAILLHLINISHL